MVEVWPLLGVEMGSKAMGLHILRNNQLVGMQRSVHQSSRRPLKNDWVAVAVANEGWTLSFHESRLSRREGHCYHGKMKMEEKSEIKKYQTQ